MNPSSPTCSAARPSSAGQPRPSSATSATVAICAIASGPTQASCCVVCTVTCWPSTSPCSGVRYDATTRRGRRGPEAADRSGELLPVVSIVGAGGLGKTRLAHVLARDATFPAVHFVELVGVSAPEDVVAEVGSALGVRDSITGSAHPDSRAAGRSAGARCPAARSVAEACWCSTTASTSSRPWPSSSPFSSRRRPISGILTTGPAPLAIAAERVYALGELGVADAAELFASARSLRDRDVHLAEPVVTRIVERLDGLPLAIELAAAKVRAMALDEIDRRLEDRFTLLRGGDRSAPDRHQTLLAVIDWSWNLLDRQRRALRRLSLFNDGFTLDSADSVLATSATRLRPGPRRPVAPQRSRDRRRRSLPDARDGSRVRSYAAGGRR